MENDNENEKAKRADNEYDDSSIDKLMEIDSKKRKGPKDITLKVKISDLPEGTKKDDVIAAIKVNGEEEQQEEEEKKKFKPKYLLPVAAILMIPIVMKTCAGSLDKSNPKDPIPQTTVVETVDFDIERYDIQNPHEILEGIVNSSGQEGLTSNLIEGDTFKGNQYSSEEQFDAEAKASGGIVNFEEIKAEIDENMQILINDGASNEEKESAARKLLELDQEVENIFNENSEFAEKYTQKFIEASEAHRDSNTDNEKVAVNGMLENYKTELGISTYNRQQIQNIVKLCDEGYQLNISNENVQKDKRGTYEISGQAVREVAEKQDVQESKSTWKKFADFIKGKTQEKSKDTNDNEKGE